MENSSFSIPFHLSLERSESKEEPAHVKEKGKNLIIQKKDQLNFISKQCEENETKLIELKAIHKSLEEKLKEFEIVTVDEKEEIFKSMIFELEKKHEKEIEVLELTQQNEKEKIQASFQKRLKDANDLATQHYESLLLQKETDLARIKEQIFFLQKQKKEKYFNKDQIHKITNLSQLNSSKDNQLQKEITNVSALNDNEISAIHSKLDECLNKIEIRKQQYNFEETQYDNLISQRKLKYDEHIAAIRKQNETEETIYQLQIEAEKSKIQNLSQIKNMLEEGHNNQLEIIKKDMDLINQSLSFYDSKHEKRASSSQKIYMNIWSVKRESNQLEEEIQLIKKEISQLREENSQLQKKLHESSNPIISSLNF